MLELKSIIREIWRGAAKVLLCGAVASSINFAQGQDIGAAQEAAQKSGLAFPPLPTPSSTRGSLPLPGPLGLPPTPPVTNIPPTNIFEIAIPHGNPCRPEVIIYGPDGAYWFTEFLSGIIGSIQPANSNLITQIQLRPKSKPFGIVAGPASGPANTIFFTDSALNSIGRISGVGTTNPVVAYASLGTTNFQPWTMTVGPDGLVWFVQLNLGTIAAFDPNSTSFDTNVNTTNVLPLIHQYGPFSPITNSTMVGELTNSQLFGLVTGPDNNLWFTEATQGLIGRVDVTGHNYTPFYLPTNSQPVSITVGPDNALWFTEYNSNKISRITTAGQITEFPLALNPNYPFPKPDGIVTGPDGNLWFTEFGGSAVGSMTTNGICTIFLTPTVNTATTYIATGVTGVSTNTLDTNIWFGEFATLGTGGVPGVNDNIGKVTVSQALSLTATNHLALSPQGTFTGVIGTFQNSNPSNTVVINWGDGEVDGITINLTNFVTTNTLFITNVFPFTNFGFLSISNTVPIGTNGNNGTFVITASHTYINTNSYQVVMSVIDQSNDVSTLNAYVGPTFFAGGFQVNSAFDYLVFPNGTPFGVYSLLYFPFVFHQDIGFVYFVDADIGGGECYLFDYTSGDWWYTGRNLFPFVFDFTRNSWLYYAPDPNDLTHYTTNPRYFFDFSTAKWIYDFNGTSTPWLILP